MPASVAYTCFVFIDLIDNKQPANSLIESHTSVSVAGKFEKQQVTQLVVSQAVGQEKPIVKAITVTGFGEPVILPLQLLYTHPIVDVFSFYRIRGLTREGTDEEVTLFLTMRAGRLFKCIYRDTRVSDDPVGVEEEARLKELDHWTHIHN